jgi:hypothetical protein
MDEMKKKGEILGNHKYGYAYEGRNVRTKDWGIKERSVFLRNILKNLLNRNE